MSASVKSAERGSRRRDDDRRGGSGSPNQLTIEQLSQASGMSVRNIRSHQARGLLAAPEVRLRVGYYGPEHVVQLRLIRELQDEGFNLGGIKRLLDGTHGTAERLLRFRDVLTAPLHDERAETLSRDELARRFQVSAEDVPEVMAKARQLGVFVPVGEDQFEVPSPALLSVAEEVVKRGISVQGALAILELIEKHCDSVSRSFVKLFVREVWKPFQQAGMPTDMWPEIQESLEQQRPQASDALLGIFQQRMSNEVESSFGEITRELSHRKR
ncbi:MAG: MerR family transcriptional regulator [Solirubrobacteraceae bacterium]